MLDEIAGNRDASPIFSNDAGRAGVMIDGTPLTREKLFALELSGKGVER